MTPYLADRDLQLYHGDALSVLAELPDQCVHMCVTSPPFFGLRDYGVAGQIGLEASLDDYIAKLVDVFREVRRVLRDDGSLWCEIGDTYASGGRVGHGKSIGAKQQTNRGTNLENEAPRPRDPEGIKPKDLIGVPWMLAFALRADGWYLRSEVIWDKPDAMPESVRDRPTRAHSQVFFLTKSPLYFYDEDAIREPYKTLENTTSPKRMRDTRQPQDETLDGSEGEAPRGPDGRRKTTIQVGDAGHENYLARDGKDRWPNPQGANARSVWRITTESTPFAHFATFPQKLVTKAILASTSEYGCCDECGAPWDRKHGASVLAGEKKIHGSRPAADERGVSSGGLARSNGRTWRERQVLGWERTCRCATEEVKPAVVLDPFVGSGTTCLVARKLGRHSIGIELSQRYLDDITVPRLSQLSLLT